MKIDGIKTCTKKVWHQFEPKLTIILLFLVLHFFSYFSFDFLMDLFQAFVICDVIWRQEAEKTVQIRHGKCKVTTVNCLSH